MQDAYFSPPMVVKSDWIDYNNHLNMAYYNVLFDSGIDQLWGNLGFGSDYVRTRGLTTYTAEFHVRYLRELHAGDTVRVRFQLLDYDMKRLHFYQELQHQDGWISATGEGLALHVETSGPSIAAMPPDILANVKRLMTKHENLPRPKNIGRAIGIRRN